MIWNLSHVFYKFILISASIRNWVELYLLYKGSHCLNSVTRMHNKNSRIIPKMSD